MIVRDASCSQKKKHKIRRCNNFMAAVCTFVNIMHITKGQREVVEDIEFKTQGTCCEDTESVGISVQ